jgi:hypothetical protein
LQEAAAIHSIFVQVFFNSLRQDIFSFFIADGASRLSSTSTGATLGKFPIRAIFSVVKNAELFYFALEVEEDCCETSLAQAHVRGTLE